MIRFTPAEHLLQELGVTEPDEIDLEAVAEYVGASVRYHALDGCEASIVGSGDRAVITVNERSSSRRRRFSIAHELGHWRFHRGKALVCRVEEVVPRDPSSPERIADTYAADLLMPRYLFDPRARQLARLTFSTVTTLADAFRTSKTSTAIRLVEGDHSPSLLICHGTAGRKWFNRAPNVPDRWFPRDTLDPESFAFGVLYGAKPDDPTPRRIGADAWFDRWEAAGYEVLEQTARTADDEILTLVLLTDRHMLEDRDERRGGRHQPRER